jgi:hypothetical protein
VYGNEPEPEAEPGPGPEPGKGLSWDEFNARYPLPAAQPEDLAPEPEPEAEPAGPDVQADAEAGHQGETEAEFRERLHRIVSGDGAEPVAEAEGSPGPDAATQPDARPESEAEPEPEPEPEPEAEPEPQAEPEAEFRERLHRIVMEAEAKREAEQQAEIRAELEHIGRQIDELGDQIAERRARQEAIYQANRDEPSIRQPEAEAEMEASGWEPGETGGRPEPGAAAEAEDAEPEMEIG